MDTYKVIGLMSGTSLDGVDIAYCVFQHDSKWSFEINEAETIPYSNEWRDILSTLASKSALELVFTDREYGKYLGTLVKSFIKKHGISADFVSSHGHTVFHQPLKGVTLQIGNGAVLAVESGRPVICDFRSTDIALQGQGAPLVPVGDHLLFADYAYCLNLGGIANISFVEKGNRIAFDICPANIVLNTLAEKEGHRYDPDGSLARGGHLDTDLLEALNKLGFYKLSPPKSLGREWIDEQFFPLLNPSSASTADKLRTCCEHFAIQIGKAIKAKSGKLYISGGGAFNKFLVERIAANAAVEVVLPETKIINYKEALIFAFLGVLRWRGEVNCFKSVTGATKDSCCGAIYMP
jgi:anhydro-N-acetylmuramic acid kinase